MYGNVWNIQRRIQTIYIRYIHVHTYICTILRQSPICPWDGKLLTTMRQVPDPLNVELGAMVVGQGALPHPTWIHNIQNMPWLPWLPMMEVFPPSLHPFISFMISNRDPNGWTANSSAFMAPSLVRRSPGFRSGRQVDLRCGGSEDGRTFAELNGRE